MAKEKQPKAPKRKRAEKPVKPETEAQRLQREEQARRSRRRTRQLLGVALTVLIIAGAVSVVQGGIGMVQDFFDNTAEREEYNHRVEMLVMFDMLPFEDLNQVDQGALRQAVLWGVYFRDVDTVARNEEGAALIPAIEADLYAADLFGPSFRFSDHSSFDEPVQRMHYEYNPETQTYTMPITSIQPLYTSQVVDIQRESGSIKRVTVAYANAMGPNGEVIRDPDFEHPARYMDYLFRRDGNNYYLYKMERSERVPPVASGAAPGHEGTSARPEEESALVQEAPLLQSEVPAVSAEGAAGPESDSAGAGGEAGADGGVAQDASAAA